jgi:chemotaxis protein CheC
MVTIYSEMQLDGLRELANIGSGNAATALSSMLGRSIDISVPSARALELADAIDAVGPGEQEVTAVVLPVFGSIDAIVLMVFSPESAALLCGLLGVDADSDMAVSALGEIGNIVGCSYIGAFAAMTGLELEPTPPESVTDQLGAIVSSVLASAALDSDIALLLDTDLIVEGSECSFGFMLVPTADGVNELLARLGLGE